MIVTLGSQASMTANTPYTFTYSPSSVQGVFIRCEDSSGNTAYDHTVTVQLGSRTIVSTVSGYGFFGFNGTHIASRT